jgi:hypothetical protein
MCQTSNKLYIYTDLVAFNLVEILQNYITDLVAFNLVEILQNYVYTQIFEFSGI